MSSNEFGDSATLQDYYGVWCAECLRYIRNQGELHHLLQQVYARRLRIVSLTDDLTVPVHCRDCHRKRMDRRATELTGYLQDINSYSVPKLETLAQRLSDGGRPVPALIVNRRILMLIRAQDPERAMVKRNHILISTSSLDCVGARRIEARMASYATQDVNMAARFSGIATMRGQRTKSEEYLELANSIWTKLGPSEQERVRPVLLREESMVHRSIEAADEAARLLPDASHPANTIRLHRMLLAANRAGSDQQWLCRARDYHTLLADRDDLSLTYRAYCWMFEYAHNPLQTEQDREKAYMDLTRAQYVLTMLGVANFAHVIGLVHPMQNSFWRGSWETPTDALLNDERLRFSRSKHVQLRREALRKDGPDAVWQLAQRPWRLAS